MIIGLHVSQVFPRVRACVSPTAAPAARGAGPLFSGSSLLSCWHHYATLGCCLVNINFKYWHVEQRTGLSEERMACAFPQETPFRAAAAAAAAAPGTSGGAGEPSCAWVPCCCHICSICLKSMSGGSVQQSTFSEAVLQPQRCLFGLEA